MAEGQDYEVENIQAKAKVGPMVYYLVKWRGYADEESTWEPASHMLDSSEIITEYETENAVAYAVTKGKHVWPMLKLKNLKQMPECVEQVGPENWRVSPRTKPFTAQPQRILSHYWTSPSLSPDLPHAVRFLVEIAPAHYGAPRQSSATLEELTSLCPKLLISYLLAASATR